MNHLRIQRLELANVGPFTDLIVEFPSGPGISLICGDNGIGKTTILESLAAGFSKGNLQRLSTRQGASNGHLTVLFEANGSTQHSMLDLQAFEPGSHQFVSPHGLNHSKAFINVRAMRDIGYARQDAINRDPLIREHEYGERVNGGLHGHDIKAWFANRYLMRPHAEEGGWTPEMLVNLETAISFFSILDPHVSLDRVDVRTFDIIVATPNGLIPYEYLSSGFRSAYTLLLGILKEIEFRGLGVAAVDFSGVIVIDEIDLHLHPTWQQRIAAVLKSAYPNAQIIATTHSPHVIQSVQASEVVALSRGSDGSVRQRSVASSRYGYAGWTLEEVLEDIMGVEDTKTPVLREAFLAFDLALDRDDSDAVNASLTVLQEMLHPNSSTRKLIEIQAAPYLGDAAVREEEK